MSVSVDGYMEGANREIDWHMVDDELFRHLNGWLAGAGGFLEGRVTYELMAEFWPTADQDPATTPTVVEFAQIWRDMPKVVYSRTLGGPTGTRRSSTTSCRPRCSPSRHSPMETSSSAAPTWPRSSPATT